MITRNGVGVLHDRHGLSSLGKQYFAGNGLHLVERRKKSADDGATEPEGSLEIIECTLLGSRENFLQNDELTRQGRGRQGRGG